MWKNVTDDSFSQWNDYVKSCTSFPNIPDLNIPHFLDDILTFNVVG